MKKWLKVVLLAALVCSVGIFQVSCPWPWGPFENTSVMWVGVDGQLNSDPIELSQGGVYQLVPKPDVNNNLWIDPEAVIANGNAREFTAEVEWISAYLRYDFSPDPRCPTPGESQEYFFFNDREDNDNIIVSPPSWEQVTNLVEIAVLVIGQLVIINNINAPFRSPEQVAEKLAFENDNWLEILPTKWHDLIYVEMVFQASKFCKENKLPISFEIRLDSDGDGYANVVENREGTDPYDPEGYPHIEYSLEIEIDPLYSGAVLVDGTIFIDPFQGSYWQNTAVNLAAIPNTGWEFSNWGGDVESITDSETLVLMDEDKKIIAFFDRIPGEGEGEGEDLMKVNLYWQENMGDNIQVTFDFSQVTNLDQVADVPPGTAVEDVKLGMYAEAVGVSPACFQTFPSLSENSQALFNGQGTDNDGNYVEFKASEYLAFDGGPFMTVIGKVSPLFRFFPEKTEVRLNGRLLTALDNGWYFLNLIRGEPLMFMIHPLSQGKYPGQTAVFTAWAAGGQDPFSYSWQREVQLGEQIVWGFITGAEGPVLTIPNVQATDVGGYCCVVSGSSGEMVKVKAVLGKT